MYIYKCASSMNLYALYYISIYMEEHLGCGLCLLVVLILLVSLLCMYLIYTLWFHSNYYKFIILTYLFLECRTPTMLSTACHCLVFEYHTFVCLNNISILGGIIITVNMALHMNNAYINHCHMDTTWSVGLAWSHLSHPDYLVIQCWVYATILFLDSITTTGPCVHCFVKCFPWRVGYIHEGINCNYTMAIVDHLDATWLFVVTAYPAHKIVSQW